MKRKIKLIWDFRGPESKEIAKHHVVHLKEFAIKEKLDFIQADIQEMDPMYCLAYITVNEKDMIIYRDALKPHRGEVAR